MSSPRTPASAKDDFEIIDMPKSQEEQKDSAADKQALAEKDKIIKNLNKSLRGLIQNKVSLELLTMQNEEKISSQNKQIENLTISDRVLRKEIFNIQTLNTYLLAEINGLENKITELQRSFLEQEKTNDDLQWLNDLVENLNKKLSSELEVLELEVKDTRQDRIIQKKSMDLIQKSLEDASQQLVEQTQIINEKVEKIESQGKVIADLKNLVVELQKSQSDLKKSLCESQENNRLLLNENRTLKTPKTYAQALKGGELRTSARLSSTHSALYGPKPVPSTALATPSSEPTNSKPRQP